MAGGFVPLPQALQLISGVPLMKVSTAFFEKLSITKRLDGGPGLQGLMQKVLQDGNLSSIMQNPMAALMYGVSVLSCMSSALSEPGGAGLGTLGLSASKAEAMARTAGFTRFRRAAETPFNLVFEARP